MRLRARLFCERNRRVLALLIATFFTLSATLPARAEEPAKTEQAAELARIQEYLNSITTIVADFNQIAPDGSLSTGKFYLSRPGRMRWQYNPPTPILMIAAGSELVYYDYELEQVSHIPLDSTLAGFLAEEHIDLTDKRIKIEEFQQTPGMIRLAMSQSDKPEAGRILFEFSDSPLLIRNMVTTDSKGEITTVSLNNAQFGEKLDSDLFVFKDPRKKRVN